MREEKFDPDDRVDGERVSFPNDAVAVWRGKDFRVVSCGGVGRVRSFLVALHPGGRDPEGLIYDEELGGYGTPIDLEDLDAWYRRAWYFTWRGEQFSALSRRGDLIDGRFFGTETWAAANGLTVMERGMAQGAIPLSEVEDLHEEREDLLAKWKTRQKRKRDKLNWTRSVSGLEKMQDGSTRAVWHGREYRMRGSSGIGLQRKYFLIRLRPDGPDPDGAVYDEKLGGYGIPIDPLDLEAWYSTTWYFSWRGEPFRASARSEDEIAGTFIGMDDDWAKANGLEFLDHCWIVGKFPIAEVENLHEERQDLLAKWKADLAKQRDKDQLKRKQEH
ncbi:hypothetical protein [Krasilnikovia sp. M28-CT-15]|uniref:hypothetical protein n=1 Tax=Krasilnikovia sp. M28-CT-15 TaxID=3373540 RepID=UPI003876C9E2